ncbi:MJ0042-type zinc finger domain-containing protein [Hyphobacterium sp.]|uniref:MJ0042-type zinc finger domain-containing protein n=1 Tax=Hyphobacterium sp. TaxID=2004662 RepID=UPI003BAC1D1E
MILSCPSCETRYRANPTAIGVNGRRVKCAACGHIWTARNEDEPVLEPLDPIDDIIKPAAKTEPETPKAPHRAFRERAEQRRQSQLKKAAAGAWSGLAVATAGVIVVGVLFRMDVVSVWPQASSAYAAVGLEANIHGMTIETLEVARGEEHSIPTVTLTGEVRNIDRQVRAAPALQARLIGANDEAVLEWTVLVEGGELAPGERRSFSTIVTDPPENAVDVEITLADFSAPVEDVYASAPENTNPH